MGDSAFRPGTAFLVAAVPKSQSRDMLMRMRHACQLMVWGGLLLGPACGDQAGEGAPEAVTESTASTGTTEQAHSDEPTDTMASEDVMLMHGASNGSCVESGMRFLEVYSCEGVLGPSPSQPPVSVVAVEHNPATLADPDYDWVVEQIEACSCTCCHQEGGVGSYRWSYNFAPAWTDAADEAALGSLAYTGGPGLPEKNNHGFSRDMSALPTTDASRLQAFVDREFARRGG